MSFQTLGLSEPILRAIADTGYTEATPIQLQAIPMVLTGVDLLAGAQTGTGKTAGFALPILERLLRNGKQRPATLTKIERTSPRVVILTPTRELAAQVAASVKVYGKHAGFSCLAIYGGVSLQRAATRR
jgi:ATP-dependent RNA helicase RhlE